MARPPSGAEVVGRFGDQVVLSRSPACLQPETLVLLVFLSTCGLRNGLAPLLDLSPDLRPPRACARPAPPTISVCFFGEEVLQSSLKPTEKLREQYKEL